LARAVVTLDKERIKGSNPWCLWWWNSEPLKYDRYKSQSGRWRPKYFPL
jgi:hypothetical protein